MLGQGLGPETQAPEVSSTERTRVGCMETAYGDKEQCAIGWGVESHDRGNLGEGLGPQEKQGTIAGEGESRRGRPP